MLCVVPSQPQPTPTYLEGKAPHGMHRKLARCEGTGLNNLTSSAQLEDRKIKTTFCRPYPCSCRCRWDPTRGTCAKLDSWQGSRGRGWQASCVNWRFFQSRSRTILSGAGRNAGGSLLSILGTWSHSLANVLWVRSLLMGQFFTVPGITPRLNLCLLGPPHFPVSL